MIPKAIHCYFDDPSKSIIYVGREKELEQMNVFWDNNKIESSIIKIANVPGIGKTELAFQFMRTYGVYEKAILIYIDFSELIDLIQNINSPQNAFELTDYIIELILPQLEWFFNLQNQNLPEGFLNYIDKIRSFNFSIFMQRLFKSEYLRDYKKIFYFDEIQTLYAAGVKSILDKDEIIEAKEWLKNHPKRQPSTEEREYELIKQYNQGLFRNMSRLLRSLIKPGVNISIISGTQYRLMNSLDDIGSPISRRVRQLNFSRLSRNISREWIIQRFPKPENENSQILWQQLTEMIIEYAGGIPGILEGFLQVLPINLSKVEKFLEQFEDDFDRAFILYKKNVDALLEEYVLNRINKLINDFGKNSMIRLLSRITRHFLFHDATYEIEVHSWINSLEWDGFRPPDAADLVQAGLFLRGNGYLEKDYLNPHSEQIEVSNPLILISKYVHEQLRKNYIDNIWLEEMKISIKTDTLHLMNMSPSTVGFAFEYYFARRLLQLSQDGLNLVMDGKSPYFDDINLNDNISLNKLKNIISRKYLKNTKLDNNIIYLLSQETAIDGIIKQDDLVIIYQVKFRNKSETPTDKFYNYFNELASNFDIPVYKILFTLTKPSKIGIEQLINNNFITCSDLKSIMGDAMINFLIKSKKGDFSI